jgi:hypothetical protein
MVSRAFRAATAGKPSAKIFRAHFLFSIESVASASEFQLALPAMASLTLASRSGCDRTLDIRNRQDRAAYAWRAHREQHPVSSPPQFPGLVVMAANSQQGQSVGSPLLT